MPTVNPIKKRGLKELYFFTVALVAAIITVIGLINFGNTVLEIYVFPVDDAEYYYEPLPTEGLNCYYDEVGTKTCAKLTDEEKEARKVEQQEQAEKRLKNERNRSYSFSLMMIMVGLPLWFSHYYLGKKVVKA